MRGTCRKTYIAYNETPTMKGIAMNQTTVVTVGVIAATITAYGVTRRVKKLRKANKKLSQANLALVQGFIYMAKKLDDANVELTEFDKIALHNM